MEFTKTKIEGLLIIQPKVFGDDRGYFFESFRLDKLREHGVDLNFVQDNEVASFHALSDLVALPFERTFTSGSAILAMSMGKAILLPSSAGFLGITDEQSAIFFEGDVELIDVLNKLEQEKLKMMGRYNLALARQLDWRDISSDLLAVYES